MTACVFCNHEAQVVISLVIDRPLMTSFDTYDFVICSTHCIFLSYCTLGVLHLRVHCVGGCILSDILSTKYLLHYDYKKDNFCFIYLV